jgi:hypothetical protein
MQGYHQDSLRREEMHKKALYTGAVVFLLALFSACDMLGPKLEAVSGPEGKAAVHVSIDTAAPRSAPWPLQRP